MSEFDALPTFQRLIKLRVAIAGSGEFQSDLRPIACTEGGYCKLPGWEATVRYWRDEREQYGAQMFRADGRALSLALDLNNPAHFSSIMANVDSEIWKSAKNPVPHEVRYLIDSAIFSSDPVVSDALEDLYEQGRYLLLPDVNCNWQIPGTARAFVDACLRSNEGELAKTAAHVVENSGQEYAGRDCSRAAVRRDGLQRWSDVVAGWQADISPTIPHS